MKRWSLFLIGMLVALAARAQSFDDVLNGLAADQLDELATPMVESFNGMINQGLYHNAASHSLPGFDVGVRNLMLSIPGNLQEGVLDSVDASFLMLPVAQASVGLVKGFQLTGRFFSMDMGDKVGQVTNIGFGARMEINALPIPLIPPKIAVQYFMNNLSIGDVVSSTSSSFDLMVSKKLLMIEPYAGLGYNSTAMNFKYDLEAAGTTIPVDHDLDTSGTRLAVGLNFIPFPLVRLNAEYSLIKDYQAFTAGLLISFL